MTGGSRETQDNLRPNVFLDTNALHNIVLYLDYAFRQDGTLFPFSQDSSLDKESIEDSIDILRNIGLNEVDKGYKEALQIGLQTIKYLRQKEYIINYSTLSEMELLGGRIAGQVRVKLASQSTPNRIWSGIGQGTFRDRISFDELVAINDTMDRLMHQTQLLGIDMQRTLHENVAEMARKISGFIYMTPVDSIIYASALDAECDRIITHDGYLRKTINLISGIDIPNDDEVDKYKKIRSHIRDISSVYLSREPEVFRMPEAIAIPVKGLKSND